jgi:hypothetical protein
MRRFAIHRRAVEFTPPRPAFAAQKEIVGDGQLGNEMQFLMNHRDTEIAGGARRPNRHRSPLDFDLALVV